MTDTIALSRTAVSELIADGIRQYETNKGNHANATGHKNLGAVLQKHMTDLKVSRTQLASEAGITANYITKIVLGERMPTPKILARFTRTLGEEFLCDWYWEISELDRASTDVSASVHLVIGDRAILKETYNRMVRECVEGNQKSTGNRNESGCRKDIDQLVRQYPEKYGVPLAGSPN